MMIAYAEMLVVPANQAGMKVPPDLKNFNKEQYPHWFVYTQMQLGEAMPRPDSHWRNAETVAGLSEDQLRNFTVNDLLNAGFEAGFPIP
jgi:hypothetical protein